MIAILKGLGFGVAALVVWMVVAAPARLIVPWIPADVRLEALDGTLWSGNVQGLKFRGYELKNADWRLRLLPLLLGNIVTEVKAREGSFTFDGTLKLGAKKIQVSDAKITTDASFVNGVWNRVEFSVAGSLNLDLSTLHLSRAGPAEAKGKYKIEDASLTTPYEVSLGTVEGLITQEESEAIISIKNGGAAVELNGKITVRPGWTYTSELKLTPTPKANSRLRDGLKLLGRSDRRGAVVIRGSGRSPLAGL